METRNYYTCEEAFVIALQNCNDKDEIMKAISKTKGCLVGSNEMDGYDDFIVKNSNLKYCYGCQSYHDATEVVFINDACKSSDDSIIALNKSLYKQGEKRREEKRNS